MDILLVSDNERHSFNSICDSVLAMPRTVNWKILGNRENHQELISLFGKDRFIHISIPKLREHVHNENESFSFLKKIRKNHIVIPTDFQSLKFLTRNHKSFTGHIVCPLMGNEILNYLDDKFNVVEVANLCGLRSSKEYQFQDLESISDHQRLVIKPRWGDGSSGVFISEDKLGAIKYYQQLTEEKKQNHVIQDYIAGEDFYFYGICKRGKILVSAIIKPGWFKHFGTCIVSNKAIDDCTKKIVEQYKFSGPISIDYRIEKGTNDVYLIEINPRNGNNFYFFNIAKTNWLLELAKMSTQSTTSFDTRRVMINKWNCILGLSWQYLFYKFNFYKISVPINRWSNEVIGRRYYSDLLWRISNQNDTSRTN